MSKRMLAAVAAALLFALPGARADTTLDLFSNNTTTTIGTIASDSSGGTTVYTRTDQQSTGTGFIDPFVRLDAGGQSPEQGYNTDFRPVQFDEKQDAQFTHSLLLADLGTVTLTTGGPQYYKFLLDANQTGSNPGISLDQLQIFQGTTAFNTDFDPTTGTFSTGATLVYSLDTSGSNNEVALAVQNTNGFNANNGSGSGDLYVYVLATSFDPAKGAFVYLYSHFGDDSTFTTSTSPGPGTFDLSSNDGFEEWAAFTGSTFVPPVPAPSTMALALSGLVAGGFVGLRRLRRPRAATV